MILLFFLVPSSGQQYELLDWLDNVTFPMEARFQDVKFARKAYSTVVRRIIDFGVSGNLDTRIPNTFLDRSCLTQ